MVACAKNMARLASVRPARQRRGIGLNKCEANNVRRVTDVRCACELASFLFVQRNEREASMKRITTNSLLTSVSSGSSRWKVRIWYQSDPDLVSFHSQ